MTLYLNKTFFQHQRAHHVSQRKLKKQLMSGMLLSRSQDSCVQSVHFHEDFLLKKISWSVTAL